MLFERIKYQTVLAIEHLHFRSLKVDRFAQDFLIKATTAKTIEDSLKAIALSTGAGSEVEDALLWLASRDGPDANWIILFDDANDSQLNLKRYFPRCSHGNILITTRNYHARRYAVGPGSDYEVFQMTVDEALTLFEKHVRRFDNSDPRSIEIAKGLVEELGCFAFSVSQTGALISTSLCSLSYYCSLDHDQRLELLYEHDWEKTTDDYPYQSIGAAWMVSYDSLTEPAKYLFQAGGFMCYQCIREDIFTEAFSGGLDGLESKSGPLFTENEIAGLAKLKKFRQDLSANGEWKMMKFRRLIRELESHSLATYDPEKSTYGIHFMVHKWARSLCDVEEQSIVCQSIVLLLGGSLVRFDTPEDLAFCTALVPHIDQALQKNISRAGACSGRFGRAYYEAGRWDDAVVHQELYKELCIKGLGDEHTETISNMHYLAASYLSQHRGNDAEKLGLWVVEARRKVLGTERLDTLASMQNLAAAYFFLEKFSKSGEIRLELVKVQKKVLGAEHPDTLLSMFDLTTTYFYQQQFDKAEEIGLQVLEAQKRVLGVEHPDTLFSMHQLAASYFYQQQMDAAENFGLQAVEAREKVLGTEHPDTLLSKFNLATYHFRQQRFVEAEKLWLQIIEVRKKVLGIEDPSTLDAINQLAITHFRQQRFQEAKALWSRILEARTN